MRGVLALLVTLASAACAPASAEEQTLLGFFEAAKVLDSTVIAKYATVGFNPLTEGVVQTFTVTAIDEGQDRKTVTIDAVVLDPMGTTVRRALLVTLKKVEARWVITDLRPIPAWQTSHAASSDRPN